MNGKKNLWMLVRLLVLPTVLGVSLARPVAAQSTTQDVPNPFVVTTTININNFTYTPVAIPAGMRLVIDYVSLSGAAESSSGGIQPIVILNTELSGGNNLFYFGPTQSTTVGGQFYMTEKTAIYADSLSVGPAFAGYTPSFLAFNVVISGHLIALPAGAGAEPGGGPAGGPTGKPLAAPGITAPDPERGGASSKKQ